MIAGQQSGSSEVGDGGCKVRPPSMGVMGTGAKEVELCQLPD